VRDLSLLLRGDAETSVAAVFRVVRRGK